MESTQHSMGYTTFAAWNPHNTVWGTQQFQNGTHTKQYGVHNNCSMEPTQQFYCDKSDLKSKTSELLLKQNKLLPKLEHLNKVRERKYL